MQLTIFLDQAFSREKAGAAQKFAPLEAQVFKAVIAHEVDVHQTVDWTINPSRATVIMLDYLLAREFIRGHHLGLVDELTRVGGENFLTKNQASRYQRLIKTAPARARSYLSACARPRALVLWYWALTFCHGLLLGQNSLSANDAYWFGLIDEVLK